MTPFNPYNIIVQGFWTGELTTMERLCMQSFIANGHAFHLYAYGEMSGIPDNVTLCDANEILPESEMRTFRCAQQFSDFFRIALLLKKGGWHTDMDNVCLRPLDFESEYVFYRDHDEATISLALAKCPQGSPMLQHCYDYIQSLSVEDRECLAWQEIGSDLILGAVEFFKLTQYAQPGYVFDPIHHERVREIVDPSMKFDLSRSYSVHLFHAAWNDGPKDVTGKGFEIVNLPHLDTDGKYPHGCVYEMLKRRYL